MKKALLAVYLVAIACQLLLPPWIKTVQERGLQMRVAEDLGRHAVWSRPKLTGYQIRNGQAAAVDFKVIAMETLGATAALAALWLLAPAVVGIAQRIRTSRISQGAATLFLAAACLAAVILVLIGSDESLPWMVVSGLGALAILVLGLSISHRATSK